MKRKRTSLAVYEETRRRLQALCDRMQAARADKRAEYPPFVSNDQVSLEEAILFLLWQQDNKYQRDVSSKGKKRPVVYMVRDASRTVDGPVRVPRHQSPWESPGGSDTPGDTPG